MATGTSAVAADDPGRSPTAVAVPAKPSGTSKFSATTEADDTAPVNALHGVDKNGDMGACPPDGSGPDVRPNVGYGWETSRFLTQVDHDDDGSSDGLWDVTDGNLYHWPWGEDGTVVGKGWNTCRLMFRSPPSRRRRVGPLPTGGGPFRCSGGCPEGMPWGMP
ncbi:hypothetical protein [Streptomyces sp. NPDC006134]|uniref:hypothetical protein n=1 Tax=Streptomyces sp. NPDC006134 TaxID=3154467 RepID=UPI0033F0EE36